MANKEAISKRKVKLRNAFLEDVLNGLSSADKYLDSRYFYDGVGDELFKAIMHCEDYYLTRCEAEILETKCDEIVSDVRATAGDFDIVELGAGDASKSIYLLKAIEKAGINCTYFPIDISAGVTKQLEDKLPAIVPGITAVALNGDYWDMLLRANAQTNKPKLVLFLGANIGNMPVAQAAAFCKRLHSLLNPGDKVLIGFDLKKDPGIILKAYNDSEGITREFNLNLLKRINEELGADFNVSAFRHYPVYDPGTGACKSYLASERKQTVTVAGREIHFEAHEPIYMEVSQKYSPAQIQQLATHSGFRQLHSYHDSKGWFVDVLWERGA